jgi:hypothetical protein
MLDSVFVGGMSARDECSSSGAQRGRVQEIEQGLGYAVWFFLQLLM